MGQSVRYSFGRNAKFSCPRCGQVVRYTSKRYEAYTQTWVCEPCVDELPVDRRPIVNVIDAETLRHPRMPNEQEISVARPLGASMSFWAGDVAATGELGLVGVQAAFAAGSVVATGGANVILAGVGATFAAGTLDVSIAIDLTGAGAAFAAGIVVAQGNPGWGEGGWGDGPWGE